MATQSLFRAKNGLIAADITYPTVDGTAGQHMVTDGAGTLSFTNVDADTIVFAAKNVNGNDLPKGTVVYVSGISGNTPEIRAARSNSSSTMPAFGILQDDIVDTETGNIVTFGSLRGLSVTDFGESGITFALGDTIYVSASEAGKLTNVAPAGEANQIQNIGRIERASPTTNMTIKVGGAGRSAATPALNDGNIFIGNSSNQSSTASFNTLVDNRLSSGNVSDITITGALNGPATFTIDPAAVGDNTGTVVIAGNLQVDGTTTTINSTTLTVDDKNIVLSEGSPNAAGSDGAGITVDGASATLLYAASGDKFVFNKGLDVTGTVTADGLTVDGSTTLNTSSTLFANLNYIGSNLGKFSTDGINVNIEATNNLLLKVNSATRAKFDGNGDISFYEDGGVNVRMNWDASAEALVLGSLNSLRTGSVSGMNNAQLAIESVSYNPATIIDNQDNATSPGMLILGTSRGTNNVATAGGVDIVQESDVVGSLRFAAADGTDLRSNIAEIIAVVTPGTIPAQNAVSGDLRFQTTNQGQNTTVHMTITNEGNVGIGMSSPASLISGGSSPILSIGGTDSGLTTGEKAGTISFITSDTSYTGTYSDGITGEIASVSDSAVGGAYGLAFYTGTTTNSNRDERLRITSSGHVGIGTDNPSFSSVYSVTSSTKLRGLEIYSDGIDTASVLKLGADNGSGTKAFAQLGYSGANATVHLENYNTAGTKVGELIIGSDGNVGIGTTTPNTNVQIYHATDDVSINVNHGTGGSYPKKSGISFGAISTSLGGDATFTGGAGIQAINTAASNNPTEMAFFTTSGGLPTVRMRIDSDGDVGIGTTPFTHARLTLGGTSASYNSSLVFDNNYTDASGAEFFMLATDSTWTAGSNKFVMGHGTPSSGNVNVTIDSAGRVGIGTYNPGEKLTVNGSVQVLGNNDPNYSAKFISAYDSTHGLRITTRLNDVTESEVLGVFANAGGASPRLALNPTNGWNVGIGTTSPDQTLVVKTLDGGGIAIENAAGNQYRWAVNADDSFAVIDSGTAERMRIDSSGNVGIGVVPESWYTGGSLRALQIGGNTGVMSLFGTRAIFASNYYLESPTGADTYINTDEATQYYQEAGTHVWQYAPSGTADTTISWSEAMRIDSSGNLLVGTTSTTVYTSGSGGDAGVNLRADGQISNSSNSASVFNRMASNGPIHQFRKDGVEVGSIGSYSSSLDIAGSSRGIRFSGSTIFPVTNAGGVSDNNVQLGYSGGRFKDLYLSGGVYLGGTGAANKLDDYEEGTFSPTVTFTGSGSPSSYFNAAGHYTKVGQVVHLTFGVGANWTSASGSIIIGNLPFTESVGGGYREPGMAIGNTNYTGNILRVAVIAATNSLIIYKGGNGVQLDASDFSTIFWLHGSLTYHSA